MARFNVGDRVLVTGLGECEVLGVREEWACVQSTPGGAVMDHDLDDIAARPLVLGGPNITKAEVDALAAAVRWAQDSPHHALCIRGRETTSGRCTCGRDEALAPFGGDR